MWTVAKVQGTEVLHNSGCIGPGHPSSTCMRTNPAREGDEMETTGMFARIEDAVADIAAGKPVVVVDDVDREN